MFQPVFNVFRPIFDVFQPIFDVFPSIFDVFQPIFDMFKPIFDVFQPVYDMFQPIFDMFQPIFDVLQPVYDVFPPVFDVFQWCWIELQHFYPAELKPESVKYLIYSDRFIFLISLFCVKIFLKGTVSAILVTLHAKIAMAHLQRYPWNRNWVFIFVNFSIVSFTQEMHITFLQKNHNWK